MQKHTIGEIYNKSVEFLRSKGIEKAELSVQHLLSDILGLPRMGIFMNFEKMMSEADLSRMREALSRRAKREPVQYITGKVDFFNTKLKSDRRALIPRPETELLVEEAVKILRVWSKDRPGRVWSVADLGCGSGNIAIAVACELKESVRITAIDISEEALALARENAAANAAGDFIAFERDSFSSFLDRRPKLDMVLANPPYIDPAEKESLQPEVRLYEPHSALFGEKKGIDYPLEILEKTAYLMKEPFALLMEIGWDQWQALHNRAEQLEMPNAGFREDYNRFKRIFMAGKR